MADVVTNPKAIRILQLHAQLGALKLEILGLKRSGRSISSALKEHYGWKGNKKMILAKLEELIAQKEAEFKG